MKKGARIIALLLAVLMVMGIFVSVFTRAASSWDKGIYVYGAGLNEENMRNTARLLGISDYEGVSKLKVDAKDIKKYLDEDTDDGSMISSVYIVKDEKIKGVEVEVTTSENITSVKAGQYANAAITAGISNVKIYVAAYTPVTGTSALTGVYKAFEATGQKLDKDRMQVANEELITVSEIADEHKGNEKFSQGKLDQAIIEVKEKLVELKEKTGELASKADIEKIINEALKNKELNNIVNQINIDKLVVFFNNFQNTGAINSNQILSQLGELGNTIKEKTKDLVDSAGKVIEENKETINKAVESAKDALNSEQAKGFFSSIGDFFSSIFKAIGDFFSSIF